MMLAETATQASQIDTRGRQRRFAGQLRAWRPGCLAGGKTNRRGDGTHDSSGECMPAAPSLRSRVIE